MTTGEQLEAWFDEFDSLPDVDWQDVPNKRHPIKDIHALILVAELFPEEEDVIVGTHGDVIFVGGDIDDLPLSREQAWELYNASVFYSHDSNTLAISAP